MSNPYFTALERLRQANVDAALAVGKKPSHGLTHTEIYRCWSQMRALCLRYSGTSQWARANRKGRYHYPEWADFENFFGDMGPTYIPGYRLSRLDKAKGFCKENCVWETPDECKKRTAKAKQRG